MNFFSRLFKRKKEAWTPNRVINVWEHNGWGNSISWKDWDKRRLEGHLTPKPRVDDEIRDKLEGGKIGRFRVRHVDHVNGVHDMFWCNVSDVGYLEDDAQKVQKAMTANVIGLGLQCEERALRQNRVRRWHG